jgi:hypothetical protein
MAACGSSSKRASVAVISSGVGGALDMLYPPTTMRRKSRLNRLGTALALLAALSCVCGCPSQAPQQPQPGTGELAGIDKWAPEHPQASQALGAWAKTDPAGAAEVFRWDGRHPDQTHELVTWAIANPAQTFDAFVQLHTDWLVLADLNKRHRAAVDGFLTWCRTYQQDATALIHYPRGLEWAGRNLYGQTP